VTVEITPSNCLGSLSGYPFDELGRKVVRLEKQGIAPIDFGVGDPRTPAPKIVREAAQRGIDRHAASGYPSYVGSGAFRDAVALWMSGRFGVELDPALEVASSVGSKEAVFHFPLCLIDPGDVVLVPNPGYPPYARGTTLAGGRFVTYPLTEDNGFLPGLDAIDPSVRRAAKVMWINYPNSPTGRVASRAEIQRIVEFCRHNDIVVASDEAYSEIYFGEQRPCSALEFGTDSVVVFQSLSKRSAMTGYRVGWVAGDSRLVDLFKRLKTNIDSGTPDFIQEAAIAALEDERHVEEMRQQYRIKRDLMVDAFIQAGCQRCEPEGTIYVWQRVPEGFDSVGFAQRLLEPDVAVVTMPGRWLTEAEALGPSPGDRHVRLALVPEIDQTRAAAAAVAALGSGSGR